MTVERLRRRLSRKLGRRATGKLVALHRRTGSYVVADDLDTLLEAIAGAGRGSRRDGFLIFRLGSRAALELRDA